ncbi:MAG: LutC/YkgG family protein [Bryobacteraceae bacterium]
MSRGYILQKVRTALGRAHGQVPPPIAPAMLKIPDVPLETRITDFIRHFENLAGKAFRVPDRDAASACVADLLENQTAVVSNSPFLRECGISSDFRDCATAGAGITSADYALSNTGTLVMLSSDREARLISLLPPLHIAVIPASAMLTSLDELFTILPDPARRTSAMVLITGPSRTADIEQILVRGVHGPGEIRVIIVDNVTDGGLTASR